MNHWIYLAIAIALEVVATSALKQSNGFAKLLPTVVSVLGYVGAFWLLALSLKTIPMGIAYAIWAGVGILAITLIGWVWFGQKLDAPAAAGIAMIGGGVLVINLFSKISAH
ncbi:DMT family transporter [Oceanobacter mangrovi]|uniref:DMT family transporter n=1 Tax=Oceanobacter mangrovi TaxID=2862510 RepID=UPI001C8DB37F|nr:multidrug efflux SMR transporter [Oceanobacter mangrovi]